MPIDREERRETQKFTLLVHQRNQKNQAFHTVFAFVRHLIKMAEEKKDDAVPVQTEESSSSTSTSSAPRFEIKKWNAVTMWSWDICADTCAICRNSLNEPSIEYQANPSPNNENGLSIAFGTCGHVFHLDCIQRWLKTRSVCPLCNKEWVSELFLFAFLSVYSFLFYTLIKSTSDLSFVFIGYAVRLFAPGFR